MSKQLPNGQYTIESMLLRQRVLEEVEGEKANDGTVVDLWQNKGEPHQRWQLTRVTEDNGDAFYIIGHPNSQMVVEAPGPWKLG